MACLLTANYFIKHHSMALFIHLSTTLASLNPPSLLSGCLCVRCCFAGTSVTRPLPREGVFLRVHTLGERCAVEENGKYLPRMPVLITPKADMVCGLDVKWILMTSLIVALL